MPIRDDIIETLVTELSEITIENGFNATVKKVTRDLKHWDQCQSFELPMIIVTDDGNDRHVDYFVEGSDTYVLRRMQLMITGYVRSSSNISKLFNKLFADVLKKIYSVNLGSNVREVLQEEGTDIITVPETHLLFQVPIDVVYFFNKTSP